MFAPQTIMFAPPASLVAELAWLRLKLASLLLKLAFLSLKRACLLLELACLLLKLACLLLKLACFAPQPARGFCFCHFGPAARNCMGVGRPRYFLRAFLCVLRQPNCGTPTRSETRCLRDGTRTKCHVACRQITIVKYTSVQRRGWDALNHLESH